MKFKKTFILIFLALIGISAYWFLKQPSSMEESVYVPIEVTAPQSCPEPMPKEGSETHYSACPGYLSLAAPIALTSLEVQGTIPDWLNATIVRTGPALFDMAGQTFKYWFDGFALLQKIAINKNGIEFTAAYLESDYYKRAQKDGKLPVLEEPKKSFFSKIGAMLSKRPPYDNGTISIGKIANDYVALTITPLPVSFSPKTLQTVAELDYADNLEGHVTTAHPCIDPTTKQSFNVLTKFGTTSVYQLVKMQPDSSKRTIVSTLETKQPSYIHSLACSQKYIILTLQPFIVNPSDLLFSIKPFFDYFMWKPELGTSFLVIDKATGQHVGIFKTDAFFFLNHINAFEENGNLMVDLVRYPDASLISKMTMKNLREHPESFGQGAQATRFTLDLKNKSVTKKQLCPAHLEMPLVNHELAGKPYTFAWAIGAGFDKLIKCNTKTGEMLIWKAPGCFPGQPQFIAHPKAQSEDDGVLVSVVLDVTRDKSFILIVNAQTMQELARAYVPTTLPFALHGAQIK